MFFKERTREYNNDLHIKVICNFIISICNIDFFINRVFHFVAEINNKKEKNKLKLMKYWHLEY